jgi:membrane protein YqaA with SNARE-associated domain
MANIIELFKNYLFVQIWVLAFILPFYLCFSYLHHQLQFKKLRINEHLEEFLSSKYGNALIFAWAASEAIYWFVIPEFFLLLVIFLDIKEKKRLIIYDFIGTVIGTLIGLALFNTYGFDVAQAPYVHSNMIEQVKVWLDNLGVAGLLFQPFSGIPYKVFIAVASISSLNLFAFIAMALFVRMARYFLLYVIFQGVYPFLHRFVSQNYIPIFILSCLLFSYLLQQVYSSYASDPNLDYSMVEFIKNNLIFKR